MLTASAHRERRSLLRLYHTFLLRHHPSVCHHHATLLPRRTHQEDQREHAEEDHGQQPEDIVERHDCGLLTNQVFDHAIRHALSGGRIGAGLSHHHALHAIHHSLRLKVAGSYVSGEAVDMYLRMACLNGQHQGNTDAGADVAHQVEDAGSVAHALHRDGIVGNRRERDEHQPHAHPLPD